MAKDLTPEDLEDLDYSDIVEIDVNATIVLKDSPDRMRVVFGTASSPEQIDGVIAQLIFIRDQLKDL